MMSLRFNTRPTCWKILRSTVLCGLLLVPVFFFVRPILAQGTDIPMLHVGKPIERELAGGQAHSYTIALAAGQYFYLVVDQRGIDVVVALFGPDGKKLTEVDSPNGTQGPEPLSFIAQVTGDYRLEVRSLEKDTAPGGYISEIKELRAATPQDKNRIVAQQAFAEGVQLQGGGSAESLRKAIDKYSEALPLWFAADDRSTRQAIGIKFFLSETRALTID